MGKIHAKALKWIEEKGDSVKWVMMKDGWRRINKNDSSRKRNVPDDERDDNVVWGWDSTTEQVVDMSKRRKSST